jgi:phenylacetate-CoA ligase
MNDSINIMFKDCVHNKSISFKRYLKFIASLTPPQFRDFGTNRTWKVFLAKAQYWPQEVIRDWQLKQLRRVVDLGLSRTDGYKELYKGVGLVSAQDLRDLDDLKRLPFTSKQLFRDNLKAFTVRDARGRYVSTSGSTGIPFGFNEKVRTARIEDAFIKTGWSWAGWKPGMYSAVLRGAFVGSKESVSNWDPWNRELALSSYFLTQDTLERYICEIERRRIRVLQAYPSSFNFLIELLLERKLEGKLSFDIVFLGSENVYPWQLERFRAFFPNCRFASWYGHCEKAVLAPWCEASSQYHSWPFYGVTEIVNEDGAIVLDGAEGEIIGTSFHQEITPFIRYKTMDYAEKGPNRCQYCGREFPILKRIIGRLHEVILTKTGRRISMTAINMHDHIFDDLIQFQFLQENPGKVIFKYVSKRSELSVCQKEKIARGLKLKLGEDMELELNQVPEIPRTRSGKYRFLDQRIKSCYGDK